MCWEALDKSACALRAGKFLEDLSRIAAGLPPKIPNWVTEDMTEWHASVYGNLCRESLVVPKPIYITGAAGTGKTTKLLEMTALYAKQLISCSLPDELLAMA